MTVGNLAALLQTNLKRMLAYSSIAHVGYMLMGLATATPSASSAVLFYLLVYAFTNIGAFIVITMMARYAQDDELPVRRSGAPLARSWRWADGRLLSLAGMPPLAGFFAKLYLFLAAIQTGLVWMQFLVIWALIMSAVSLYYYGRVIHTMWMTDAPEAVPARPGFSFSQGLALAASVAGVVVIGIVAGPFLSAASNAADVLGR